MFDLFIASFAHLLKMRRFKYSSIKLLANLSDHEPLSSCYIKVYQMYLVRQWSNFIVPNVWMYTPPSRQDTTILMVRTLELAFHICCLWYIQNIGQSEVQTSSCPGLLIYAVVVYVIKHLLVCVC